MEILDINKIIEYVSAILDQSNRNDIIKHLNLDKTLSKIDGDKAQITQVIINICQNAYEAMIEGGTLFISTKNVFLNGDYKKQYDMMSGDYILISIKDTGIGIDAETRKYIFKPFFTTKKDGSTKGTGLGLSYAFGIIKSHGGIIEVENEEFTEEGSNFNIYLPKGIKISSQELKNIGKRILVIDDVSSVRELLKDLFEYHNHKVFFAKDGYEAISTYKEHYNDIDLVFLDMVMPGMNGKETFVKLIEINPKIIAYLMTGFSKEELLIDIKELGIKGIIEKPFNIDNLLKIIHE